MQVEFEQTHIIRPAPRAEVRRFAQTFRWDPFRSCCANSLFGALGHYVILMQYTPQKPCCQAIFRILAQYFCQAHDFMVRTGACKLCAFWLLIFEFCTFSPKTPLCILYTLALDAYSPLPMQKAPQLPAVPLCPYILILPDSPAGALHGWDGAACAEPWPRSAGCVPGSR